MQQITIIGHLGKDAIIKKNNGSEFLVFNVCVTEIYKKESGEKVESSTWYSCINKKTNLAQHLNKGDKVLVQGELRAKTYQNDRRETQIDLSVQISRIQLLSSKSNSGNE
ncbi:single-stranded DNA-binding protein [Runella sp.]|uniref:single-stranded DNA-binding protein n=1 Tax=Runella sp. TaxID=1960881 RepID=UPI003D0D72C0